MTDPAIKIVKLGETFNDTEFLIKTTTSDTPVAVSGRSIKVSISESPECTAHMCHIKWCKSILPHLQDAYQNA